MEPFRVLEHTADIGFEAFGLTREETFANAARALFHLITDLGSISLKKGVSVEVTAPDLSNLLVNWLSEILYLFDAEGWLFGDFEVHRLDEKSLSAVARGEKFDSSHHQVNVLVKAITYHQLIVEKIGSGWRAQIYVDI